jgi:MoaA/NifB/PqqE/SkfB family radical SAM enzyme
MNPTNQTTTVGQAMQLAVQHHQAERYEEAESVYNRVLQAQPDNMDALHLLGMINYQRGENDTAISLIKQAIVINPNVAVLHGNLGNVFKAAGDFDSAAMCYQRALSIDPGYAQTYNNFLDLTLRHETSVSRETQQPLIDSISFFHRFQIEITTDCNLKCAECPRTVGIAEGSWTSRHMPIEEFRQLVKHAPYASVAVLQGVGEPTLHPQFEEFISIIKSSGKFQFIALNTNALTRSVDYYKRLFDLGLTSLSISVDSLNQEIAAICRFGTKVEKLKQRIVDLAAISPDISISMVASKLNFYDIPDTLAWLNSIGRFLVEIQPAIDYKKDNHQTNALSKDEIAELVKNIHAAKARLPNISLGLPPSMQIQQESFVAKCNRPFLAPYVTLNGFLTPCCTTYDESLFGHSNLIKEDIAVAWRRPAVSAWLHAYVKKTPDICKGCCFNSDY